MDHEIVTRYTNQPERMPAGARAAIEAAWNGAPVQLYALADLDAKLRLSETWVALGPVHLAVARRRIGGGGAKGEHAGGGGATRGPTPATLRRSGWSGPRNARGAAYEPGRHLSSPARDAPGAAAFAARGELRHAKRRIRRRCTTGARPRGRRRARACDWSGTSMDSCGRGPERARFA